MIKQYTTDWGKRFTENDTPWEESEPSYHLEIIIPQYTHKGQSLLEVGCGLGVNARWFAELGYNVQAIDIAKDAIERARDAHNDVSNLKFAQHDFIKQPLNQKFDIVFDKGCLHTFSDAEAYSLFAKTVSKHLNASGIWINISGNADQVENLSIRKEHQYPRMSMRTLTSVIEPHFEILEIKRGIFGETNNFLSWVGVYQKRAFYYE